MTIAQWNTAAFGPDYRLPPLEARGETFTWSLPADVSPGELEIRATVYMTMVVSSVADYMKLPSTEKEPRVMGETQVEIVVR